MGTLILLLVLLAGPGLYCYSMHDHLHSQGHAIAKRFAKLSYEFDGHDIAQVLYESHPNTFHRIAKRDLSSVTNKATANQLRLDLDSGNNFHLILKKRSIIDADTEFYEHTEHGLIKRDAGERDCFAVGHAAEDPLGLASASLCDGLHATLTSNGMDYYIHPVEADDVDHKVHVFWRRSVKEDGGAAEDMYATTVKEHLRMKRGSEFDAWKTEKDLVIEMALFTDAHYWNFLHEKVPGREDEYLLVTMGAVQALYGDPEKVGYDVLIKVKAITHWKVDPEGYNFVEDLETNLSVFCALVRNDYEYDMLLLHTGVTQQNGPAAGMAYVAGVCKKTRCADIRSVAPNRHALVAHEIGHNLGFLHHEASNCPDEIKSLGGSFMGGGDRFNFSPCNKWELQALFESGKGECLFEETGKIKIPKKRVDQPRTLPGQSRSPDRQCELYAGKGFKYFRPYELDGDGECKLFLCIDLNKKSSSYGRLMKIASPQGFPCGDEMFCREGCESWEASAVGWDINYLRELKKEVKWSAWSKKWSKCSRKCGTGVQIKERKCLIEKGPFLTPYCKGDSIKARACNKKPCGDDPETIEEIRQARGDERCAMFYKNNVDLTGTDQTKYLPKSTAFVIRTTEAAFIQSKSCILQCERDPAATAQMDGVMISGTPCLENTRTSSRLERHGIEMRCVLGRCLEFSKCSGNEPKDECGVCGGDELRCKSKSLYEDIPEASRVELTKIPKGSTGIDLEMIKRGARIELWSADGQPIVGVDGQYPKGKYLEDKMVVYAGTEWSIDVYKYLRADGPLDADVVVKLLREDKPLGHADINYLLGEVD